MKSLKLFDPVMINAVDGFGGPGFVVEVRDLAQSRYKVRMNNGSQPDFWAHDGELAPLAETKAEGFDSRPDTYQHIQTVQGFMQQAIRNLLLRAHVHDRSKLVSPELELFNEFTPKLANSTYGSDEYKGFLAAMGPALSHHYAANSHHPEHYSDGIRGMTLLDLIEMLCDWKAATMRHKDGSLPNSIEINQKRFGYSNETKAFLVNTVRELQL